MFKKELADVLKQTGWFLAAVAVIPIPIILLKWAPGPYPAVFIPALEAGLVFWSLFLGASLLGRERGQRAMEYALTLPHSRMGLLLRLAAPRLLVLVLLLLTAWLATGIVTIEPVVFPYPALALVFCLPLFFASLSLSLLIENFIVLCLASLLGWYVVFFAVLRIFIGFGFRPSGGRLPSLFAYLRPDAPTYRAELAPPLLVLLVILPVVPFLTALLLSVGRFDVRRPARFKRRFGFAFAAGLAFCVLAAFGGRAAADALAPKQIYLTRDLRLVEWKYEAKTARIRGPKSSLRIRVDAPGLGIGWDDGAGLFVQDYNDGLNRIDLATGRTEALYHFGPRRAQYWRLWTYGPTIAFFESGTRPDEIQLVALDGGERKADKRRFTHAAFRAGMPALVGTDVRDGKRFWLCLVTNKAVHSTLRLWQDGRVEEILVKGKLETANLPRLVGGLLFFTGREPTLVMRDGPEGFETVKEFAPEEDFSGMGGLYSQRELDASPVSHFYAQRGPRLVRVSLDTLEAEDIGAWAENPDDTWGYVFRRGNRSYFVGGSRSRKTLEFHDLGEGRMRLLRRFADVDTSRRDTRFSIFESGIVLYTGNRVGIYAFPDMREILYK